MEASKKIDQIWFWKWDELTFSAGGMPPFKNSIWAKLISSSYFFQTGSQFENWDQLTGFCWQLIDILILDSVLPSELVEGGKNFGANLFVQSIAMWQFCVTVLSDSLTIWNVCQCRLTVSCDNLTRVPSELMLNIWQLFQMSARRYKMETKVRVTCFGILLIWSKHL